MYFQFGTSSGQYSTTTATQTSVPGEPVVKIFEGLQSNMRYYYRSCYKKPADATYTLGMEHTFHTQRAVGSPFLFTVESDPHPYDKKGSHTLLNIALQNQSKDSADFLLDLGDTFGDDHLPFSITSKEVRQLHLDWREFFGVVCHSSPLFLCLGNHEGESGFYLLQTPPNNLGVYGTLWRKFYFPNPVPDGFYSGNSISEDFDIGFPENYYAYEWGDALFVVLDAYRYYTVSAKPRQWEWTLGKAQYDWLKQTLGTSKSKFKFVFAHHTLGETRGGISTANLYEWGGYEADGITWGFTTNRPGWAKPIHQLMVANGVTIYFQGHDHLFAKEELDGMVYQAVPMPSDSTYMIGMSDNGGAYSGIKLDGSGYLRVTVMPDSVDVDYVQAWLPSHENATRKNGQVAYSYSVKPKMSAVEAVAQLSEKFVLEQNYPNPFNLETVVSYQVPALSGVEGGVVSRADLRVYDLLGREIAVLVNQEQNPGKYTERFDGSKLQSGLYFYRLIVGEYQAVRKMVVLK